MRHAFTSETARENGRKGNLIRWSQTKTAEVPQIAAVTVQPFADDSRKQRMLKQIDLLDTDIESTRDPELRCKLITAKARLWELLYPKPGSLRPKQQSRAERAPVQPLPIEPKPALVAPVTDQNHNGETAQS